MESLRKQGGDSESVGSAHLHNTLVPRTLQLARVDVLTTQCKELNDQLERLRDELQIARKSSVELTTRMHDQEDVIGQIVSAWFV